MEEAQLYHHFIFRFVRDSNDFRLHTTWFEFVNMTFCFFASLITTLIYTFANLDTFDRTKIQ